MRKKVYNSQQYGGKKVMRKKSEHYKKKGHTFMRKSVVII